MELEPQYKSSLADIEAGDVVVLSSLAAYGEGSTLVKVKRTTATQIVLANGVGEMKFNRYGNEVGKSDSWHGRYIKAPLQEYYSGRTALDVAKIDMENARIAKLRDTVKAQISKATVEQLEAMARVLGIEV